METLFQKSFLSQKHGLINAIVQLQYSSIKTYFRYSKNNLYSFFNTGHLDFDVVEKYGLRKFLFPLDMAAYDAAKARHTETAISTEEEVSVIQVTPDDNGDSNVIKEELGDVPRQLKRKSRS
jgi:hypothetical protein